VKNTYLEVTESCNLDCLFCSVKDRGYGVSHSLEESKEFLDDCIRDGYKKVMITGGEPLLYPELVGIVKYASGLGFEDVTIQTNGTLIGAGEASDLKAAGVTQVIFSIHSHLPSVVDTMMVGKGVLEKQLRGLDSVYGAGIETFITTVITTKNYRMLPEFFRFITRRAPYVEHYTLNFVDPVGRSEGNQAVVPRVSEVEPFLIESLIFLSKADKTFRVERVPLCYMLEFAEYSTELRRISTKEPIMVKRGERFEGYGEGYIKREYVRSEACNHCWLKGVCPGLKEGYADIYGTKELYPVFLEPEKILERAGKD